MSGTSMDGIDAAIIKTDGKAYVEEIGHYSVNYPSEIQKILKATEAIVRSCHGNIALIKQKDFEQSVKFFFKEAYNFSDQESIDELAKIKKIFNASVLSFEKIVVISTDLHIQAINQLLKKYNLKAKDIDLIGYHGKTLYHNPQQKITIQIGDGQQMTNAVNIPVVNNFREKDVKNGGQGAPFALYITKHLRCAMVFYLLLLLIVGGLVILHLSQMIIQNP